MNPVNAFVAPSIDWAAMSPYLIVFGAAVVGVLVEAFVPQARRRTVQTILAVAALGAALVAVVWRWSHIHVAGPQELIGGAINEDAAGVFAQGLVLIVSFIAMLIIADRARGEDAFTPTAA